jgi:FkbM family methyltransferase
MQIEIPEQDKLNSQLLNNIGIAVANEPGGVALPTALAMVRRAFRLNPLDVGRMLNLASLLVRTGEDDEAEHLLTICLKREPKLWLAWQVLGFIRTNSGDLDEAIDCFKRAYDIDPGNGQRKFDLAAAYLRAGDFARGLPLYEFRHEILPRTSPPPPAPTWDGTKTGHLAIWCDQGHGDRIMFARFLPWAKERADKITLLTDPDSVPFLIGYASIAEVAIGWTPETRFDHQVALGSLPLLYGMTPNNIPADPGMLSVARTEGTLGAPGLKIGIVWFGNPAFPGNDLRTVPFEELLPLAADPRNTVFSLQVGSRAGDIAKARAQRIVHDMCGQIEGAWSHTAAVIKNLDLVVSSCTAVAHLAGALGVPTFIMLPQFSDWRWLWGRDDTPWYSHTRLFRQTRTGEWKSVVARVVKAVDQMHERRALVGMLNQAHGSTQISAIGAGAEVDGVYEPDVVAVMRRVLRPGDLFVDVGANVGLHTALGAELVGPSGRVIAFEPGSNNLPALREATERFDNVTIIDRPLAEKEGEVTFWLNADGGGGNALWDPADWPTGNPKSKLHKQPVTMQATTLNDKLDCGLDQSPRLIKIDTEGAEQRVLEGATLFLSGVENVPFVVAELHEFGLAKFGHSQQSIRKLMEGHGYATHLLSGDGGRPRYLSPEQDIRGRFIVNLLYATPQAVEEAWGDRPVAEAAE